MTVSPLIAALSALDGDGTLALVLAGLERLEALKYQKVAEAVTAVQAIDEPLDWATWFDQWAGRLATLSYDMTEIRCELDRSLDELSNATQAVREHQNAWTDAAERYNSVLEEMAVAMTEAGFDPSCLEADEPDVYPCEEVDEYDLPDIDGYEVPDVSDTSYKVE